MTDTNDSKIRKTGLGDQTVETATHELFKQLVKDGQPRPRRKSPLIATDPGATADLAALFQAIDKDARRIRDLKDRRDASQLDATLP